MKRSTGFYCWVGGERHWHRTMDGAMRRYSRAVRIYGPSVVQVDSVATGGRVS